MVLWFIVDTSDTRRQHSLHCGVTKVRLFDPCAILRKERVTQGSPLVRIDSTELPDRFKLRLALSQYGRTETEDPALVTSVCVVCTGTRAFAKTPRRGSGSCTWKFTAATTPPTRTREAERDFRNIVAETN
jgi:hypothetical protein